MRSSTRAKHSREDTFLHSLQATPHTVPHVLADAAAAALPAIVAPPPVLADAAAAALLALAAGLRPCLQHRCRRRTPCTRCVASRDDNGRCLRRRSPCRGSAAARVLTVLQPCLHMLAPPHSSDWRWRRPCSQRPIIDHAKDAEHAPKQTLNTRQKQAVFLFLSLLFLTASGVVNSKQ